MSNYNFQLRKPQWQKKRLEIMQRDNWSCLICKDQNPLNVHHKEYWRGYKPWEYPNEIYMTLCEACHNLCHFSGDKNSTLTFEGVTYLFQLHNLRSY